MKLSVMDSTCFWKSIPDLLQCSWASLPYSKWFPLVVLVQIPFLKGPQPREDERCLSVLALCSDKLTLRLRGLWYLVLMFKRVGVYSGVNPPLVLPSSIFLCHADLQTKQRCPLWLFVLSCWHAETHHHWKDISLICNPGRESCRAATLFISQLHRSSWILLVY